MNDLDRWLTIAGAATRLGVTKGVVYDWIRRGHLRHERHGRRLFVHLDDLLDTEKATRERDRTGNATRRTRDAH